MSHNDLLVGIRNLSFSTDGLLGSPCTAVCIPSLDLVRGRILLIVGDRRHGKGALRSALRCLLAARGDHLGTATEIQVMQPPHDNGTHREPINVGELAIAKAASCLEATEAAHLAHLTPQTNILLSDDPADPAYIVGEATKNGLCLILVVDSDRVGKAVSAVSVREADFLWLRCGSPFVGPISFADFRRSFSAHCDSYKPPTAGASSDIAAIVRDAMARVTECEQEPNPAIETDAKRTRGSSP